MQITRVENKQMSFCTHPFDEKIGDNFPSKDLSIFDGSLIQSMQMNIERQAIFRMISFHFLAVRLREEKGLFLYAQQ